MHVKFADYMRNLDNLVKPTHKNNSHLSVKSMYLNSNIISNVTKVT